MGCDSAHGTGVFVVDFTLDDPVAIYNVIGGGGNRWSEGWRRRKTQIQLQGSEDLAGAELVEAFSGDALDELAEENESDVAVLGPLEGSGLEGHTHGGGGDGIASGGLEIEFAMGGQAGGMGEQHSYGDRLATGIERVGELREEVDDFGVERKLVAVVEEHRHGGGGDGLGERGEVPRGFAENGGRVKVVGEGSEWLQGDEGSAMGDGEGSAGKNPLRDGLIHDGKGRGKLAVLVGGGVRQID